MVIRRTDGSGRLIIVTLTDERIDRGRRVVKGICQALCVIGAHELQGAGPCRLPRRIIG